MRDHLNDRLNTVNAEKEIQLEVREKRLTDQQQQLDRARDATDEERKRLLELVKSLEIKLSAVSQTSSEEQWTLRQKMASLEAEKVSFERERDFAREQQSRDEKRVEELKQFQLAEYERLMRRIEDEKLSVIAERTKLETIARLQKTIPSDNTRVSQSEVDAAIKVAQDAARQSDEERERLLGQQRRYEKKKRELIDQENSLRSRENDLEIALNSARAREHAAESSIRSAKLSEQKVIAKLQIIQKNARDLSQRELTLANDKLAISQERVAIQNLRKKLFESRCSLCKIGEQSKELSDILTRSEVVPTMDDLPRFDLENMDVNRLDKILDMEVMESLQKMNYDHRNHQSGGGMNDEDYEINLDGIPNINDVSDEFLDENLLRVKFDALLK